MIELRWIVRASPVPQWVGISQEIKVLQYRQRLYESLGPFSGYSNKCRLAGRAYCEGGVI